MIVIFLVNNKNKKVKFFKKIFLLVNISLNMIFEIFFLILSKKKYYIFRIIVILAILYYN